MFCIEQVRERKASRETDAALVTAVEVLRKGVDLPGGKEIRGQKDARAYVLSEFSRIDKELSFQESPEGNMREETEDMWKEYQKQQELNESGGFQGVKFGIDRLDESLNGLQAGDLALTVGYTSSGKTTVCVQLAWWAAIMQGVNVVYITTETRRPQVRRKVIARHSCLPMFGLDAGSDPQGRLLPGGLDTLDIRRASLSPRQLEAYKNVLDDMRNNPEYGSIDVVQMPSGGTMADATMRAARIGKNKRIELVVLDYLELVRPVNPRDDYREGLNNNIQYSKEFATTFNDGQGVAVISPWQVSRKARDEAATNQSYTLQDLGETKKASDTPDTIISVLEDLFRPKERIFELSLAVLKQRDGAILAPFKVDVDYATSRFGQAKQGGLFGTVSTSGLGTLTLG
jgi:replicative DNA helicase